ncbi:MAG: PQQ-binding-like beta-propeller repeat protein [Ignavibacteria bacterium]|nr:PQQ-binding-like beta-propeller repeat protein [Ignavibacteria bacterium]
MKKILITILLFLSTILKSQEFSFGIVSNLQFSESKKAQIDSLVKKINTINQLPFVLFTGSLTGKGSSNEFLSLKNSLDSLKSQYILLPFGNDTRDVEGWETFLDFSGDDKFVYNSNGYLFIGINPTLPYLNINTYTSENIEWLKQIIDSVKLNKEIYFVSPVPFQSISGWESVFEILIKKNLKLIINCNAVGFSHKSILGIGAVELPNLNGPEGFIFTLTNEKIRIDNLNQNLRSITDKSISVNTNLPERKSELLDHVNKLVSIEKRELTYASTLYWNGKIYTASYDGIVTCYDSTGQMLWDYNTFGNVTGTPVISDRILAIATLSGDLITLSAITGEQIQTIGFEERITTSLNVIDYQGSKILMIPKLSNSKSAIVFGTSSGKIYCYDLETLQEYWVNTNSKGMIRNKPFSINNKIFFTADDGFLYCIDARNGLLIWRWKEKADTDFSNSSIASDGKKIFVVSAEGTLFAIDNLLGKFLWKNDKVNSFGKLSLNQEKKLLITKGRDSKIYLINSDTGKIEREIKYDGQFSNSFTEIIPVDGNLVFTNDGSIYKSLNNMKYEPIYYKDYSPFRSLERLDKERFIASKYNGSVLIFSLR